MRFTIINGQPFVVSGELAVPCLIKDNDVKIEPSSAKKAEINAIYTLNEIVAKLGDGCSSIKPKKPKAKKPEEEQ